jgi:hypothetical protein
MFLLACGFQSSFWPNLISFLPSPQLWLITVLFISMRWKSLAAIFYIYFLLYFLTFFSEIPLKMLWTTLAIVHFAVIAVRDRIQLAGVFSFILFTLAGSFLFETGYFVFSDILEPVPTTSMILDRLLQILVNFIFSYPMYFFLDLCDRLFLQKEDWRHSEFSKQSDHPELL